MQTNNRFHNSDVREARPWLALSLLVGASLLLVACSPVESGVAGDSNSPEGTGTPQSPTPATNCPPQELTQETTVDTIEARVVTPETPSPDDSPTIPPSLIDLTEREFPDQTAATPDCEPPATITPGAPTAEQTSGE